MIVHLCRAGETEASPGRSLRWDLAWQLFLPEHLGDVPGDRRAATALTALVGWAWMRMGTLAGRLKPDGGEPVTFVVPPLSAAGKELVVRVASFWADEVYAGDRSDPAHNLWTAPVADLAAEPAAGGLDERCAERDASAAVRHLFPQLGFGRARMMLEVIAPGYASARLHSHSAVDEYYLVLDGRGTLRMGGHRVVVARGALVGKPLGPDLTSHFLADQGESLTILDIEVWPEAGYRAKDVVDYPDFAELFLRGSGWGITASRDALLPLADFAAHYGDGYRRGVDGGWTATDIPGAAARRPESD